MQRGRLPSSAMAAINSALLLVCDPSTGRYSESSKPVTGMHARYPLTSPTCGCSLAEPSVYPVTQPPSSMARILSVMEAACSACCDCFFFFEVGDFGTLCAHHNSSGVGRSSVSL